mgnify:CR=1 FL=1
MGELNTPIDVISVCAADGSIKPLRFRMEDGEHKLRRMDPDARVTALEKARLDPYDYIFLAC